MTTKFNVSQCQNNSNAMTNCIFVNSGRFDNESIVMIKGFLFKVIADKSVPFDDVQLNRFHREFLYVSYTDQLDIKLAKDCSIAETATFEVSKLKPNSPKLTIDESDIVNSLNFTIPFNIGMKYFITVKDYKLILEVKELTKPTALISNLTSFKFVRKAGESSLIINTNDENIKTGMFKPNWSFNEMGVGGLNEEFTTIFRRAFASRIYPTKLIKQLGLQHVKGILLYGPPGTGKTLMARQIGKMLNCVEPKIVNGPEIFDKMVGESEKHIRELFADAEHDEAENGENAQLHLIIFDEIDSICKRRGTTNNGTGVNDQVVNQLLTKIDGVNALNDVLIIGMTNRRDLIDEALLRPGRLEVQVEVHLPDENGRKQIFDIHTKTQRKNKRLAQDVDINELAKLTSNYTGAEIAGVVRSAASFAMAEHIDINNLAATSTNENIMIKRSNFIQAIDEVKPEFGIDDDLSGFEQNLITYSDEFADLQDSMINQYIKTLIKGKLTHKQIYLIHGDEGCGLTSFAISLAVNSKFKFIRLISGDRFVGMSEDSKCVEMSNIFSNAGKVDCSAIIIDNIERIIEYTPIGPRFSNKVLQTILILLKKNVLNKLAVFITTNLKNSMENLGLIDNIFDNIVELKRINSIDSVIKIAQRFGYTVDINGYSKDDKIVQLPIKKLIQAIDMAAMDNETETIDFSNLVHCMQKYS